MTRSKILTGLLALALVVSLVGWFFTWRSLDHSKDLDRAGDQATAAAREAAVQMTSYNYKTLDKDFAWVEEAGTARFQEYFADASAKAKPLVTGLQATAKGQVVDAAPKVKDAKHVSVLLYVDQTITSASKKGADVDQPRVTMKMVLQNDKWLVDSVQLNNLLG